MKSMILTIVRYYEHLMLGEYVPTLIMMLLIGLFTSMFLSYWDYRNKKRVDTLSNIRGAPFIPFFGNALQYLNYNPESMIVRVKEDFEKYGKIYRVWILNRFFVVVNDVEIIESILNSSKHITKSDIYRFLRPWLKEGLLLSTRSKWFHRRRIITPAFHFSILKQFVQIFDEQSNILIEKLQPVVGENKVIDIHHYTALAALDAVSESAMGVKINAQSDPNCAYIKAISRLSVILANRFLKATHFLDVLFSTIAFFTKRRHDKLLRTLHSFTQKIIVNRKKLLEKEMNMPKTDKERYDDTGKKKRMAFLDLILKTNIDGMSLSNDDIKEEVDTFTFEAHGTTTSGICFTLFLISRHPKVQKKMFEEIREIFGDDKTRPTTYSDLQRLKYTENVIKEGLRMYPPVSLLGRIMEEDLNVGDQILPAGASVHIPLMITMRNSKLFCDPDSFIPERHSWETSADTLNPFAFIPFSAGPRNCIGQKFAMLQMKNVITKVLRHYELLPLGEELRPIILLVLRSLTGYQMGLIPRVY